MLRKFYLAIVMVYPCQFNRVHCFPHVIPVMARAMPGPSLVSTGNYHTLKRYFPTMAQARKWASYMLGTYSKGTREHPLHTGNQLSLF
jgi:hypothetical protein